MVELLCLQDSFQSVLLFLLLFGPFELAPRPSVVRCPCGPSGAPAAPPAPVISPLSCAEQERCLNHLQTLPSCEYLSLLFRLTDSLLKIQTVEFTLKPVAAFARRPRKELISITVTMTFLLMFVQSRQVKDKMIF